uniref:Uncharacterized protein n=1 Tax=Tanacetum cinerariifolium TaxID=118510 RepID=A0A699SN94_TANCI|nr:hypothetical protein [Tanacetum cinerariifolium]
MRPPPAPAPPRRCPPSPARSPARYHPLRAKRWVRRESEREGTWKDGRNWVRGEACAFQAAQVPLEVEERHVGPAAGQRRRT